MTKIRKVLMLVENATAPSDQRVWNEATALRDHNFQICIICPKSAQHPESHVCIDNIHIYRYHSLVTGDKYTTYLLEYGVALLMMLWLSLKVVFRHGFDVIHTANPPDMFFILGLIYRPFGKKFVFDQHDLSPELFKVKFNNRMEFLYKLLVFLERCACQTAHLVIVPNLSQKKVVIERGQCSSSKVFMVRNGPDLRRIRPVTPEPELKRGKPYLLAYVGIM